MSLLLCLCLRCSGGIKHLHFTGKYAILLSMLVRNGVPVAIKNKHQNLRAPGGRVTARKSPLEFGAIF